MMNGISLEVRQVARVLEAEILCRWEVNETETRRNVVAEASAVVQWFSLCESCSVLPFQCGLLHKNEGKNMV